VSKAHVPSVFEALVPPLRVFLFATQELMSSDSNTYVFLYILTPIPLKQWNTVTVIVIHYCIIVMLL